MNVKSFKVPTSANYTEFLRDYLEDNALPNSLSDADTVFNLDFKDLFTKYFYMREIGFMTEELFTQKLNVQIDLWLPYYIEKATKLQTLFTNIFENGFTITQQNNLTNTIINEVSSDVRLDYNAPLAQTEKALPVSSLAGGSENTNTRNGSQTNTGSVTTTYSKNPRYNSLEALKTFQEEFKNIIKECLHCFDCLFMQVY